MFNVTCDNLPHVPNVSLRQMSVIVAIDAIATLGKCIINTFLSTKQKNNTFQINQMIFILLDLKKSNRVNVLFALYFLSEAQLEHCIE